MMQLPQHATALVAEREEYRGIRRTQILAERGKILDPSRAKIDEGDGLGHIKSPQCGAKRASTGPFTVSPTMLFLRKGE